MYFTRAHLLLAGLLLPQFASAKTVCSPTLDELTVETFDSPFFEHYHLLKIPVSALISPPPQGLRIVTTPMDLGSHDVEGFRKFIHSSGLNPKKLLAHTHEVHIEPEVLHRIARGEKEVEIRLISPAGNYVHNLKFTAYESVLRKVQRRGER